jgi:hypothetical protein
MSSLFGRTLRPHKKSPARQLAGHHPVLNFLLRHRRTTAFGIAMTVIFGPSTTDAVISQAGGFNGSPPAAVKGYRPNGWLAGLGDAEVGGSGAGKYIPGKAVLGGSFQSTKSPLADAARDTGTPAENFAEDGAGMEAVDRQATQLKSYTTEHGKPRLVILSVGTNVADLDLTTRGDEEVGNIFEGYKFANSPSFLAGVAKFQNELINKTIPEIYRNSGGSPVALLGIPPIFGNSRHPGILLNLLSPAEQRENMAAISAINLAMEKAARAHHHIAFFVDTSNGFRDVHMPHPDVNPMHFIDLYAHLAEIIGSPFTNTNFHSFLINAQGNERIASQIAQAITKLPLPERREISHSQNRSGVHSASQTWAPSAGMAPERALNSLPFH